MSEKSKAFQDAPHFCQNGHPPIRHWDSEHESCPLCVGLGEAEMALRESIAKGIEKLAMVKEEAARKRGRGWSDLAITHRDIARRIREGEWG
jgi:hypothetical protein